MDGSSGHRETTRVGDTIGAITRHIGHNARGPGDRLPSEAQFTGDLSMSRTVVREAFRARTAMRLIDLSAGRRATVARLDHGTMSAVNAHGLDSDQEAMLGTHVELAAAIAAGDPAEAARLMERHFDESVRTLVAAGLS
jgi:DNA-binding FadR family transcriptional regulator